jgi:hypothetical protein
VPYFCRKKDIRALFRAELHVIFKAESNPGGQIAHRKRKRRNKKTGRNSAGLKEFLSE